MLKSLIIAATLLTAPAAHARTWYSVDMEQGLCSVFDFDGMTSPGEIMAWARANGSVVTFQDITDPIHVVILTIDDHNDPTTSVPFFTTLDDCQKYLAAGQAAGVIMKPNMN